jgi:Domain of unknown function (DUF4345)
MAFVTVRCDVVVRQGLNTDMTRRALQWTLAGLGLVAVVFGLLAVIGGAATIPGGRNAGPNTDSELRFFAAWYALAGTALLRAARAPEQQTVAVRGVCLALVVGATGRVVSLFAVGRPATVFVVLMVVEYAIALVVVPWHAAVVRQARTGEGLTG